MTGTSYVRATAGATGEVPVAAGAFWAVLVDWGAVMDWHPRLDDDPPAPVTGCELLPGHDPSRLPCTRRIHLRDAAGSPYHWDETLLHVDPVARRIYYRVEQPDGPGPRNYHATTTVDAIGAARCRISCFSQFDVETEQDAAEVRQALVAMYERSVIRGIGDYLLRGGRAQAPAAAAPGSLSSA